MGEGPSLNDSAFISDGSGLFHSLSGIVHMAENTLLTRDYHQLRLALLNRQEVALIDVREEVQFASGHPLFAVNISLSKLDLEILNRIPRLTTPVTVYDNGEGLAQEAVARLREIGYPDVALLAGGLSGWTEAGGELFSDVNAPSKAFGQLLESRAHTPLLSADEVNALLHNGGDVVVLDARRFDEYLVQSIPGSINVPGGELVLRSRDLAPSPETTIIVVSAERTRSIIGAQSLIDSGLPNPVYALRDGLLGWSLAGLPLESSQTHRYGEVSDTARLHASRYARTAADKAGVQRATLQDLQVWQQQDKHTVYLFDVRDEAEYLQGHLPGARHVPGGQLIQETDHYASVRGAWVVLIDDEGVRANISASWLAQLGWQTFVLDGLKSADFSATGGWSPRVPPQAALPEVDPAELAALLAGGDIQVLDFTTSANYVNAHIPGAAWIQRSALTTEGVAGLPDSPHYVVTCGSSLLARYSVAKLEQLTGRPVLALKGGNTAWKAAGLPVESGETRLLLPRVDRYPRPYEDRDVAPAALRTYLDWERGLIAQLDRDGSHGFRVLR